jgi:hypothetical protein
VDQPTLTTLPGYPSRWSACGRYRYTLWRSWGPDLFREPGPLRYMMVIGLNPSTATDREDDPTVLRCWRRARRLGYDAFVMTNLFGRRATDPRIMIADPDPVGAENDEWLRRTAAGAAAILAAWGTHGRHMGRDRQVLDLLGRPPVCLDINADGTPKHPLYVASDQPLRAYRLP